MKKYLITGLIILLPLALTIYIFVFLVDIFTDPFLDMTQSLLSHLGASTLISAKFLTAIARIITIIFLIIFIFILGFFTRVFFLNGLIKTANYIFSKTPFVKSIYKATKDIVEAFIQDKDKRKSFQYATMVSFPSKDSYCIGFVTGEVPSSFTDKIQEPLTPVFVPTAPHPISGYLVLIPIKDLKKVEMTNEEAVKFTVSCGVLTPEAIRNNEEEISNFPKKNDK